MAIVTYLGLEGYKNRWFMPYDWPLERPNGQNQEAYWYSFTRGAMRVIGLNSESHLDVSLISDVQLAWLKNALIEANQTRADHPWVVVMMHRPLYCSTTAHTDILYAKWLQMWLEDLFMQFKVDLVITAHMHNYERTWPTYKGVPYPLLPSQTKSKAPIYLVNGSAGCRENLAGFSKDVPEWSAVRILQTGYGTLSVNMTALVWRFYSSADNFLQDTMVLTH